MFLPRVSPAKYLTFAYLFLVFLLCFSVQAQAAQVTLAWDASNPVPDGYRLFQRTASGTYNYSSPVWSGTATTCTIANLANSTNYYYVVRAFDGTAVSGNSNEVTFRYDPPATTSYTITATAGSNGTISPSGSRSVSAGGSQSYTITPNTGYRIASVLVDGTSVGALSSYTFNAVNANHTISASFIANSTSSYTITSSAGSNGTISPLGSRTVSAGGSLTYTITPNSGYRIANVLIDGTSVGAVTSYTFSSVRANHTIRANFILRNYTITSSAGSNGTISPLGSRSVASGGSQSYTITPNSGYRIASVLIDGTSVGAVTSYTFSSVRANHTIQANFTSNNYTITSSAGSNGTISPLGSRSVASGGSLTYTITPNSGYRIASVLIDGTSVGAVKSYTFSSVRANHTIRANFIVNNYTITSSAGSNGTISPLGSRSVPAGSSQRYTITPNSGYRVARVLVDGASIGAVTSYTFSSLNASHTISASFTASTTATALSLSSQAVMNQAPNADAGPDQSVNEGRPVTLSGLNSMDNDDGIASYQWRQIQGPTMPLSNAATAEAAFTAPAVTEAGVSLTFELSVSDQSGATAVDTCIVNVTRSNAAPTANAGLDQTVAVGDMVDLSAIASTDPDNGIAAYRWVQIQGPAVTLTDASGVQLSFTAPAVDVQGTSMIFQLTVTDNGGLRDTDTCMVTVERENAQPIAHAGADQQVKEGAETKLDGSASMDPDNGIAGYVWKQIEGKPVTLSDAGAANPVFTAPQVDTEGETLTFQVTVKDKNGLQSVDRCQVFVQDVGQAETTISIVAPTAAGTSLDSAATP